MKKRYILGIIILIVAAFFVLSEHTKKVQIEKCEMKILEATERAITALDNYTVNSDFGEIGKIIKELEICYKYLREIEDINGEEIAYWNISVAISQLKSYDSDDKIVALNDLMKALNYMKENIYTVGEGYFASFVNYNMK